MAKQKLILIEGCVIYDDQIEDIHLLGIRFKEDINSQTGLHYMNTCRKSLSGLNDTNFKEGNIGL